MNNSDHKTIVSVKTSYWHDKDGAYLKKSLRVLKRKSSGYNVLLEDCGMEGAESVLSKLINLNEVQDGVYKVIVCNESRDWETGYVDDWDLKLVPFVEEEKQ